MAIPEGADQVARLESWKEIAAYLCRSERTVRRWERTGGLPVHRLANQKRSGVYAFRPELDAWWNSQASATTASAPVTAFPRTRVRQSSFAAGLVTLAVLAGILWRISLRPAPASGPVLTRLTFDVGSTGFPAVSRDGRLLAYASDRGGKGDQDVWIQPLSGGEPLRLTDHPATDRQVDLSPDGSSVVFRSDREGGGIYLVSVRGGGEKRIADHGYNPRYSPDGAWISYSTGGVQVVNPTGGPPKVVQSDMEILGGPPLWTPDGKHLLFMGAPAAAARAPAALDWWVVALDGGPAVRTGVSEVLQKQGLGPVTPLVFPNDWRGHSAVFSATSGDATNVWHIAISPITWKPAGPARQLTFGTGAHLEPRVSPDGRLVFTSENCTTHIWRVPLDANRGIVTGGLQRLTSDGALTGGRSGTRPRLSADGRRLVFSSRRRGELDIWVKDLASGRETAVAGAPWPEDRPLISPDGSKVVYLSRQDQKSSLRLADLDGGGNREICHDCGSPDDWSADGRLLLYTAGTPEAIFELDLATAQRTVFARRPGEPLRHATFSPDAGWVAWVASGSRLFVARHPGAAGDGWRLVAQNVEDSSPQWSPDGNLLYFLSERDDHRCIWAQRLDPLTRAPQGQAFPVYHFHTIQHYPWTFSSLSVARGQLAITLTEVSANLWMAEPGGLE